MEVLMARSPYGGDKRRREIAKKKKREAKLARKHSGKDDDGPSSEDTSYLEYLHPGGLPEELQTDSEEESEDDGDEE
jgi:hypothetical protein